MSTSGASGSGVTAAGGPASDSEVTIHVIDEARNIRKDFVCNRHVLTQGMCYFQAYLADSKTYEEIDISVHCDVQIFDWLVRYMVAGDDIDKRPHFSISNIVSILISSDFLQMGSLVEQALLFFKDKANQVVKLPVDLSCLSDRLLDRLALMCSLDELEELRDRKDKLCSKLYRRKLQDLLQQDDNFLSQCAFCHKLFTEAQSEWSICTHAQPFVDRDGSIHARHTVNLSFDIRKYLLALRSSAKKSWRQIFWQLWSVCQDMHCTTCQRRFQVCEYHTCNVHTRDPIFLRGDSSGFFACCDASVYRFDPFSTHNRGGCKTRPHTVALHGPDVRTQGIVVRHSDLIPLSESRQVDAESPHFTVKTAQWEQYSLDRRDRMVHAPPHYGHLTEQETADMDYALFITATSNTPPGDDEDDGAADALERGGGNIRRSSSFSDAARPSSRYGRLHQSSSITPIVLGQNIGVAKKKNKTKPKLLKRSQPRDGSPSKTWKNDFLRHNDRERMGSIIAKLAKLRTHHASGAAADSGSASLAAKTKGSNKESATQKKKNSKRRSSTAPQRRQKP